MTDKPKVRKKHYPNGVHVHIAGTEYVGAPCGALVRLTRKLDPNNPVTHNNSKRRRYAKGKY
jgi:hypothetical protein